MTKKRIIKRKKVKSFISNRPSKFDKFADFREAKRRGYPIKNIAGYPQGKLAIVPRKVIGRDKRDNTQGRGDLVDAGIIRKGKKVPTSFFMRLANDLSKKERRETFLHEINHWKYKKHMLDQKLKENKGIKKLLKINPEFRRGESPREEAIVQAMTQARLDSQFNKKLREKFPSLYKKIRRHI